MSSFLDLGVPRKIDVALERRGITAPFAIQTQTITHALDGRDVCGRAPTGSGKTLAFSIPLAAAVTPSARAGHPTALILVPTRELASQVAETLQPLAQAMGRRVATFYGGTPIANDQRRLRKSIDIAVACPGRLIDLVQRGDVSLDKVSFVVLDEADRMADMGFLPDVQRLLDMTTTDRQTLLFSATLDGDVDVLIRRYQHDPVRVELHSESDDTGDVRHLFWHAEPHDRVRVTGDIIAAVSPAIVFTRTKHGADRVAKQLQRRGVTAVAIHGNRTQKQRERALADFTAGRAATLVATDVAARGIHVDNVGVVVHFDPPASSKDYVHRSGRTGRAGADGVVVTLVPPDKRGDVKSLQRELSVAQSVDTASVAALLGTAPAQAAPAVLGAATTSAAPGPRRPPRPRQPEHRRPGRGNPPKRRRTAA